MAVTHPGATPLRRALITGGSSGIGRAAACAFVEAGWQVTFTYRSGAERAAQLEAALGDRAVSRPLDLGRADEIDALVRALPDVPDAVIHCAALGTGTVADYVGDRRGQDEALLRVNALGPLWLTQALLPRMLARGRGRIVFVGSVGGSVTHFPGFRAADGMSKAALTFYARQLAAELAHQPIDVFLVSPGATDTPMLQRSTLDHLGPRARRAFVERLPRGRLIAPAEIAALILALCGDGLRALHGAVLDASLGLGVSPGLLDAAAAAASDDADLSSAVAP